MDGSDVVDCSGFFGGGAAQTSGGEMRGCEGRLSPLSVEWLHTGPEGEFRHVARAARRSRHRSGVVKTTCKGSRLVFLLLGLFQ